MQDIVDGFVECGLRRSRSAAVTAEYLYWGVGYIYGFIRTAFDVEIDEWHSFDYEIAYFLRHYRIVSAESSAHVGATADKVGRNIGFRSVGVYSGREFNRRRSQEFNVACTLYYIRVGRGLVGPHQLRFESRLHGE